MQTAYSAVGSSQTITVELDRAALPPLGRRTPVETLGPVDDALVLGDGDWVSLDDPSLYKPTAQIWGPKHPALGSPKSWRSALLHPTNVVQPNPTPSEMWLLCIGLDLAELSHDPSERSPFNAFIDADHCNGNYFYFSRAT